MGKPRLPERLKPHRPLSTVVEENENEDESEVQRDMSGNGHGHKANETGKGKKRDVDTNTNTNIKTEYEDDGEALPIEIDVHGLKAKVYANCSDVDIVPARYLEKADRSPLLKRTPWIFRTARDGRTVNLGKWSKVDIRYRGVFKTLRKVPQFTKGLFEDDTTGDLSNVTSSSSPFSKKDKFDFEEAAKAQGQVVYALLDEILVALKIRRDAGGLKEYFFLRPRLLNCQPEYWTGYRIKHRDSPFTAGSLSLDYEPERRIARAVVPVFTSRGQPLTEALEDSFKLLLAQLLVHIHRLSPPGDKLPDQETFLITLHGSRLHILRGVFPGQKTSRLWCGRHNPPPTTTNPMTMTPASPSTLTPNHHNVNINNGTDPEHGLSHSHITNITSRFYTKLNLQRFMEQIEWNQLSNPENEASPRGFQILASREYDLWKKDEFFAAVRLLAALAMYLMSGTARCGILQDVFARWPYDEGDEDEDDLGGGCGGSGWAGRMEEEEQRIVEEQEKLLREEERRKAEEDRKRVREREAMRESGRDRIAGIGAGGGFRQPWWDWVWEDKTNEGRVKNDDSDVIFRGP
ncbi:hypothetical protein ASPCAL03539 [Aspergillus calidoustus]|uniref:Uncharacterized protein n=1 Tax=Aspergillus calidoustus TaxID=454130 RepID=A0A0U5FS95_ASPCI|nr:hypothetical protein ASPCAL03539 [Aspergillus calidoustus]